MRMGGPKFLQIGGRSLCGYALTRSSSTPFDTEGIGRDFGIPNVKPRCKSRIDWPSLSFTSSGNVLMASLALW